ncbi:MAG TPA: hypothetical protein VK841_22485 [Polyangiaceae bacterium]|jgi:hypothetical protein|nr:hypothetical protein [Polyangiaceae bacterium]
MSAASPFQGFTGQAYLEWVDSTGTTKTFIFDNVLSEEWDDGADITEHPVEKGPDVADHIRDKLPIVTLVVHATNEPIDANNFMTALTGPSAIQIPRPNWTPGPGIVVVPTWQNLIGLRSDIGALLGIAGGNGAVSGAVAALNVADAIGGVFGISNPIFDGVEVDVPVATDAGLQPPTAAAPFNVTTQT